MDLSVCRSWYLLYVLSLVGTGFGILSRFSFSLLWFCQTVAFMTTDSLRAVPHFSTWSKFSHGSDSLANNLACSLEEAARSGIFAAVVFRWRVPLVKRAIPVVVGNQQLFQLHYGDTSSARHLFLTMGIGNTVMRLLLIMFFGHWP